MSKKKKAQRKATHAASHLPPELLPAFLRVAKEHLAMVPCAKHGGGYTHVDEDHFDREMEAQAQLLDDVLAWEGETPTNVFLAARWARAAGYLADVRPHDDALDDAIMAHEALGEAMFEWNGQCWDCIKAAITEMDAAGGLASSIFAEPKPRGVRAVAHRAQPQHQSEPTADALAPGGSEP